MTYTENVMCVLCYQLGKAEGRELAKAERREAYEMFAERVIDLIYDADGVNPVSEWQIRNLVKEMVGEDDAQAQQDRAET